MTQYRTTIRQFILCHGLAVLLLVASALPAYAIVANDTLGVSGAVNLGTPHSSVVSLFVPAGFCTGTLIDPTHILTAKHCTAGASPASMSVQFYLDNDGIADATYGVTAKAEAAGTFSILDGTDIAVLTLDAAAPAGVTPRRIGFGDAVGHTAEAVGFGYSGIGSTGATIGFDGQRKAVDNVVDWYGAAAGGAGGSNIFSSDFDSGSSNSLAAYGSSPTPLVNEGTTAGGDSGGPLFIDGKIYGVLSSGSTSSSGYGDISWWTGAGQHYSSFIKTHAPDAKLGIIPTAASDASFSDLSNLDILNIDFGTVAVDDVVTPISFDVNNLPTALATSSLDLLSTSGSGDTSALMTDLAAFVNVYGGDSKSFSAMLDTSAAGNFSASYDLSLSDYLGNNQTLTLNITGIVEGGAACAIGDADCDGYVTIGEDILQAFANFTGPGSFGKTRVEGDIEADDPIGATTNLDPHDGDVDVSDVLTMFANFTGPPSDDAGLGAAEAGDPSIPDLIYDATTGEVVLDPDGSGIIGYSLKSAGAFLAGGHTPVLGGVSTSLSTELAEAALSSPGSAVSIGLVLPTGLDLASLTALLTTNEVSRSLGAPLVPFDLVVVGVVVPEPSTLLLSALALVGMSLSVRRRRAKSTRG